VNPPDFSFGKDYANPWNGNVKSLFRRFLRKLLLDSRIFGGNARGIFAWFERSYFDDLSCDKTIWGMGLICPICPIRPI